MQTSIRGVFRTGLSVLLAAVLILMISFECISILFRHGLYASLPWVSDIRLLLLQTLAWVGAARLWLGHEHLVFALVGRNAGRWQRGVRIVSDVTMVLGALWLLPQIASAIKLYSALTLPVLPLPLSVKLLPPFTGVLLLCIAAMLNLLHGVADRRIDTS